MVFTRFGFFIYVSSDYGEIVVIHHDTEEHIYQARTLRSHVKAKLSYSIFYHVEHHLFPRVPTQRLYIIAQRLDAYHPDVKLKKVF